MILFQTLALDETKFDLNFVIKFKFQFIVIQFFIKPQMRFRNLPNSCKEHFLLSHKICIQFVWFLT